MEFIVINPEKFRSVYLHKKNDIISVLSIKEKLVEYRCKDKLYFASEFYLNQAEKYGYIKKYNTRKKKSLRTKPG